MCTPVSPSSWFSYPSQFFPLAWRVQSLRCRWHESCLWLSVGSPGPTPPTLLLWGLLVCTCPVVFSLSARSIAAVSFPSSFSRLFFLSLFLGAWGVPFSFSPPFLVPPQTPGFLFASRYPGNFPQWVGIFLGHVTYLRHPFVYT